MVAECLRHQIQVGNTVALVAGLNPARDYKVMVKIDYIFGHVQKLTFVVVNFSVMFANFGHIHLVILIR